MHTAIPDGVWPTMITPYTEDDRPDFAALEKMVEWYIAKGCAGIFAVCQSSEMFYLSPREKLDIAKCVRDAVGGRIGVIASGHTADAPAEQRREIAAMAELGLDAIVLVTNRLARKDEDDAVFAANARAIIEEFPQVRFGMYECPYPYKRLVGLPFLRECAAGGGLGFLKDTCCDPGVERERAEAVAGSGVRLFNANTATLLSSLRAGYRGYNGVMANYHPDLYVWLLQNFRERPEAAEKLGDLLTVLAISEARCYPVTAKYHFARSGVPMLLRSRSTDAGLFNLNDRLSMDGMIGVEGVVRERLTSCDLA